MPSDFIWQNETDATMRTIVVDLKDGNGNPVGGLNIGSVTLNLAKRGGNYGASAGATLTAKTGGAVAGPYELQLHQTDTNTIGDLAYEITDPGVIIPCRGVVPIRPPLRSGDFSAGLITAIQAGLALQATVSSILTDVLLIPTNPLLTNDVRLNHLNADVSTVAAAVWDILLTSHTTAGTFGDAVQVILGLLQNNTVVDNFNFNGNGLLVGCRIRQFADAATATAAATGAGDGVSGEIRRWSILAVDSGPGTPNRYQLTRTL